MYIDIFTDWFLYVKLVAFQFICEQTLVGNGCDLSNYNCNFLIVILYVWLCVVGRPRHVKSREDVLSKYILLHVTITLAYQSDDVHAR